MTCFLLICIHYNLVWRICRVTTGIQPRSLNSEYCYSAQQSAAPDLMSWDGCLSRWELGFFGLDLFWWRCNPQIHPMPGPYDWISRHGWGTVCAYTVCVVCVSSCVYVCLYDLKVKNFDSHILYPCCFFIFLLLFGLLLHFCIFLW